MPGEKLPFTARSSPGIPQAVFDTVIVAPVNDLAFVERRLSEGDIAALSLSQVVHLGLRSPCPTASSTASARLRNGTTPY